jgi:hypothetical protein
MVCTFEFQTCFTRAFTVFWSSKYSKVLCICKMSMYTLALLFTLLPYLYVPTVQQQTSAEVPSQKKNTHTIAGCWQHLCAYHIGCYIWLHIQVDLTFSSVCVNVEHMIISACVHGTCYTWLFIIGSKCNAHYILARRTSVKKSLV